MKAIARLPHSFVKSIECGALSLIERAVERTLFDEANMRIFLLSKFKNRTDDGSYIHNSIIKRRLDDDCDALFTITEGRASMITKLDGYAIIPKEEYEKLLAVACA